MRKQSKIQTVFEVVSFIFILPGMIVASPGLLLLFCGEKYLYDPYNPNLPDKEF